MFHFTVDGRPLPKERPRLGRNKTYTPSKTLTYEAEIGWAARVAMQQHGLTMTLEPVALQINVYHADKNNGDLDNIIKTILDGLNGVAYKDDKQVHAIFARAYWNGIPPRIEVAVAELP